MGGDVVLFPQHRNQKESPFLRAELEQATRLDKKTQKQIAAALRQWAMDEVRLDTACFALNRLLPEPEVWYDCGSFYIAVLLHMLSQTTPGQTQLVELPSPRFTLSGKKDAVDGVCPYCQSMTPLRLLGEGDRVDVMCHCCSNVYTTNEEALETNDV